MLPLLLLPMMMVIMMLVCVFVCEVKDYVSRAEQLKQLLKPNHTDTCDGAPPPRELGLYCKRHDQHILNSKIVWMLWRLNLCF